MKAAASLLLGISCLVLAADKRDWKAGRVLDAETVNAYIGSTSVSPKTSTHGMKLRSTELLILGDEYAYVIEEQVEKDEQEATFHYDRLGRPIRIGQHGCHYIVNAWISYAYEGGNKLYVNDINGKTCKLDHVRQERLQPKEILDLETPAATSKASLPGAQPRPSAPSNL
jgi:hypothetical protein